MTSYFQSYFQASSMPKRLLQYALSRLEILDTDTLDLEHLNIAWGKNSVIEFKDVGLRLKKLDTIFQLPTCLGLSKASILLLRLTIPVDIYSSPILVEVDGVECQLQFKVSDVEISSQAKSSSRSRKNSDAVSNDLGSANHEDYIEAYLPSVTDLAQSFLQTEPEEGKAKLEAALSSEAKKIGIPVVSDDEEDALTGTGTSLSVPTFMARFLQGIVDRLQVKFQNVNISLNIDVPNEISETQSPFETKDSVTIQLRVQDTVIEGVTQVLQMANIRSDQLKTSQKLGKRLIILSQIRGYLISEASFFSSLASSSALSHLSTPNLDPCNSVVEAFDEAPPLSREVDEASTTDSSNLPSGLRSPRFSASSTNSNRNGEVNPVHESHFINEALSNNCRDWEEGLRPPYSSDDFIRAANTSSLPEDSIHSSQAHPLPETSCLSSFSDAGSQSPTLPSELLLKSLQQRNPQSYKTPSKNVQGERTLNQDPDTHDFFEAITLTLDVLDDRRTFGQAAEEDLTKSRLFSHDEAESMYMSAISHTSSRDPILEHRLALDEKSNSVEYTNDSSNIHYGEKNEYMIQSGSFNSMVSSPCRTSSTETNENEQTHHIPFRSTNTSRTSAIRFSKLSRQSKQILELDRAEIYIPSVMPERSDTKDESENISTFSRSDIGSPNESVSMNIPGAFSIHSPRKETSAPGIRSAERDEFKSENCGKFGTEINIGTLTMKFDVAVGKLILKLANQVREVLKSYSPPKSPSTGPKPVAESSFELNAEEISLKFLDCVEGFLTTPRAVPHLETPSPDILLQAKLKGLCLNSQISRVKKKTSISLKSFLFGYKEESILSFDANHQLKGSVRDLNPSAGIEVSVQITQTDDTTYFEVSTLPMHVSINLQKLDETFSWFGGLGSVLSLGSSVVSNATIIAGSPTNPKARSVRFETSVQSESAPLAAQMKANIRIGGFKLDLKGSECGLSLLTSALKIVGRDEGIGLSIQKIQLSGPHLYQSNSSPAITVEVISTRVEFLSSPNDSDLDRLLSLITPSKTKYGLNDDILLDTLLSQRNKGAVLRLTIDNLKSSVEELSELNYLPELGEEVSRLATVAKYLPDDDRPGLLSLILIRKFDFQIDSGHTLGNIHFSFSNLEVALITLPALLAISVDNVSITRNSSEKIIGTALDPNLQDSSAKGPVIMARIIGNEMEPVFRIKVSNLKFEYHVSTIMTLLEFTETALSNDISASISASVTTLTGLSIEKEPIALLSVLRSRSRDDSAKPVTLDIDLRDCVLGLNPLGMPSKVLLVLTEAYFGAVLSKDPSGTATVELKKASILVVDDVANLARADYVLRKPRSFDGGSSQVTYLCEMGYVSVGYISSARAIVHITTSEGERIFDVEVRDDLLVLESCADSTQTLIAVLNGLIPPIPPPCKDTKYRTKVIPVHDLLASLSADAFGTAEGDYDFDDDFGLIDYMEGDISSEFDEIKYSDSDLQYYQNRADGCFDESASPELFRDAQDGVLLENLVEPFEAEDDAELEFRENHFGRGSILEVPDHKWNSANNTYDRSTQSDMRKMPLKVCVRDVHIIWNLFDGYDWQHTRDTIAKAVQDVEIKATERLARAERGIIDQNLDDDEPSVIEDFLFNSIYIGVPANRDPRELASAINQDLNDNATETESIATTSFPFSTTRSVGVRNTKTTRLEINRSRHHKITFELRGVFVDFVAFPFGSGETQSSVDIRVRDLDIFDHVPTSTWKKFATYMLDAGERETGSSMIHLEILNVKPVVELAASEIVFKATVLPLRLHVDQDALDFITRFFEFKDDFAPVRSSGGEEPFLQRVEINSIRVRLDFKPKRVDYAGLRSGHTTEFMNFLILDEADIELRHTIIYGISGFKKLGKCLNDIWMPDVKRNQLPGILAGLAPVKSLVNVGGGFRHLVLVPIREYKKDGRIVHSISKGAAAFAKVTGTELIKLGAKVAVGVQTVLQGAEGFLGCPSDSSMATNSDNSEENHKQISLYANQPIGVLQGLRGGYHGLQRDLVIARDAIIAVPGEVMERGTAVGALKAVGKYAPTVILRPAIGVAKASGQILMGATNSLDPVNLQRAEAVSDNNSKVSSAYITRDK